MEIKTEKFKELAAREIRDERNRAFRETRLPIMREKRQIGFSSMPDTAAALANGAAIRGEVLSRLPELLEQFEKNATANGARVLWARDAKELNELIRDIALERGVKYVTKGKSMVTEESGLNELLEKSGIEAWETDLGEFIAQLLHRPPFHIVGPAINVPVAEVRDIFLKKANLKTPTLDPIELGYAARLFLRDKFHHVRMGITGVNVAVAETGTIINVENEGNIRLTKSSPQTQVSVMSLEKVVPTMKDALYMIRLLCRSCTGQKISAYVSMDSGPKKKDEIDGPEELIIIIVDNGRSKIYQDPIARDALRCIRCAACLNFCPVYRQVGGYSYGWAYSGPMGQMLNPLMLGLDKTQDLYRASTLCGACKHICPTGIDHPSMFLYYRAKDVAGDAEKRSKPRPWTEKNFFKMFARAATHPWMWELGVKMARPVMNREARGGAISRAKGPFDGWFRNRDFPAMAKTTFHERWKKMK
ncbi:MAG TPA: lactate utilization protein B [Thermodesulfobacteriota bacterium]|nr:lactate utilization protein B [Thermodesulfobacteriota bacterium]